MTQTKTYHHDSLFGPGPRRALDREQRARFRFLVGAHARASRLPPKQAWVAEQLLRCLGETGQCDPSQATLATLAAVSERTVRRAISTMRHLGLLYWRHRIVRAGWRVAQTSNAYVLCLTENPTPRCAGQTDRQTRQSDLITVPPPHPDVLHARKTMAQLQAERTRKLAQEWHAAKSGARNVRPGGF